VYIPSEKKGLCKEQHNLQKPEARVKTCPHNAKCLCASSESSARLPALPASTCMLVQTSSRPRFRCCRPAQAAGLDLPRMWEAAHTRSWPTPCSPCASRCRALPAKQAWSNAGACGKPASRHARFGHAKAVLVCDGVECLTTSGSPEREEEREREREQLCPLPEASGIECGGKRVLVPQVRRVCSAIPSDRYRIARTWFPRRRHLS
jgi:hypothetical protein